MATKPSNEKGWRSDNPSRCGASHYIDATPAGARRRSECGRAFIALARNDARFRELPTRRRKDFMALGVCDPCQTVRRKRAASHRPIRRRKSPGKLTARRR